MVRQPLRALPAAVLVAGVLFLLTLPDVLAQTGGAEQGAVQDARTILERVRARQAERWTSVSNYTVVTVVEPGVVQTPIHYEKITVGGEPAFRVVPRTEYERRVLTKAGFPPLGPEFAERLAQGHDMLGEAFAAGGEGAPPMDIRPMTDQMALFLRAGAAYREDDGRAEARDARADMDQFVSRARFVGVEDTESGSPAFLVEAADLFDVPLAQPKGGGEYRLEKVGLWIDTEHYVPLRLRMDGQVTRNNTVTPFTIERLDLDYRQVGPLYESHRQIMRLTGVMEGASAKDRKQMEKARKDMAKARQQLAAMPEGPQKAMVMKMMKPQLEKFERLVSAGAFEATTRVVSIAVNEGPPTIYGTGALTLDAMAFPGALTHAADQARGGGGPVATLSVAARREGEATLSLSLYGQSSFFTAYAGDNVASVEGPGVVGSMPIQTASGEVRYEGPGGMVTITGGSGVIKVTRRSRTRIAGTFEAQLTTDGGRTLKATGSFDTATPVAADQAPRGSPFPAELF